MAAATQPAAAQQPLSGIRVIEVGLYHAGPTAAAMLGALGAEVIKVEDPKRGDPVRATKRLYGQDCVVPGGRSTAFEAYNGGKKGVTLSLTHEAGRRAFCRLIAKSDVFIHNMRKETAAKLGIDYESLLKHNPKLVYATVSGFGPAGPEAGRPGIDPVGMARSSLMSITSGGSHQMPVLPASGIADRSAGMVLGYGVLAALLARERTGAPQLVETSLVGGALWLGQLNVQHALFMGRELLPPDRSADPLFNCYRCQDGRYLFISALTEPLWPELCAGIEMLGLLQDPRFAAPEARWQNRGELMDILQQRFAERSSEDWARSLRRQPGLISEVVRKPTDVADDPQLRANGYVVENRHPQMGTVKRVAFPLHMNGAPAGRTGEAPGQGEHTAEVLSAVAGLSSQEIEALRAAGAA